jgi:hypothetical protein
MKDEISITQFIKAIKQLPSDKPKIQPGIWYKTQKEHWVGWLNEYGGPGAYGRKSKEKRDAKYAYNHIVNYKMLLWLISAGGVTPRLVKAARSEADKATSLPGKSAAIRKHVPWEEIVNVLWGENR